MRLNMYSLMTAMLGSVLGYVVYTHTTATPASPKVDDLLAFNHPAPGEALIKAGTSRERVLKLLGTPNTVNTEADQWIYGDHAITFRDDVVVGCVQGDFLPDNPTLKADGRNVFKAARASAGAQAYGVTGGNSFAHNATASKNKSRTSAKKPSDIRKNSASSRANFRNYYNPNSANYSYYLGRSGPTDRPYFRKPSLPRGMSRYGASSNYPNANAWSQYGGNRNNRPYWGNSQGYHRR